MFTLANISMSIGVHILISVLNKPVLVKSVLSGYIKASFSAWDEKPKRLFVSKITVGFDNILWACTFILLL